MLKSFQKGPARLKPTAIGALSLQAALFQAPIEALLMPTGASERGFNRRRPCLRPSLLVPKVEFWGAPRPTLKGKAEVSCISSGARFES